MPFTFKLARRLARILGAAAATASLAGCGDRNPGLLSLDSSPSSVTTVIVAPSDLSAALGASSQFTAIVSNERGEVMTGPVVTWSSSDTTVVTVSQAGVATAVGTGTARIAATSGVASGFANASVTPVPSGTAAPATVTDLQVTAATDASVSVTFTEVTDGAGGAAQYELRYAAPTISWDGAVMVPAGGCTSPFAGTAVGAVRTCTIPGLAAATAYDFQIRAFRTASGNAKMYGGLSAIAKGSTTAAVVAAVASITLSPASSSREPGQTQQFAAVVRDAAGNEITGRALTWASSNSSVASVDPSGLVTALTPGTATITADAEGHGGDAAFTVTAPAVTGWPNEPSGFVTMTDQPFSTLTSLGWRVASDPSGNLTAVNDATAPQSPSSVMQVRYPAGFTGGSAPGTLYYAHGATKEVYAGFYWKPSSSWQNHPSNVNKIAFWQSQGSGNNAYLMMYGGGSYHLDAAIAYPTVTHMQANVNRTVVTLGQWHRIEWHLKYATTSGGADGVLEWWLDGVLQGRYTDIRTPADAGYIEYQISPTWGGIGSSKAQTEYYWYDHVRLSHR